MYSDDDDRCGERESKKENGCEARPELFLRKGRGPVCRPECMGRLVCSPVAIAGRGWSRVGKGRGGHEAGVRAREGPLALEKP